MARGLQGDHHVWDHDGATRCRRYRPLRQHGAYCRVGSTPGERSGVDLHLAHAMDLSGDTRKYAEVPDDVVTVDRR